MKELYIFDFDGTLVDSYRDSIKFFNITLEEFNLPTFDLDVEGLDYQVFREFLHEQITGIEDEFFKSFTRNYKDAPQDNTFVYDNVIDVLCKLQDNGITLAICSNRQQKNLEYMVDMFFDDVDFKYVSGTVDELHAKPDPYRVNQIIEEENVDRDNVLFFGDKIADIEAARGSGIDMILVTYGQGNDEAYDNSYPLMHIDSFDEILSFYDTL